MRPKQARPRHFKKPYRNYSPTALTSAYKYVKESGASVRSAALLHGVPETTLRDRILGNVDPETVTVGKAPLFTQYEEVQLVNHFKKMADYGYGYSRRECVNIASDFAIQLGKRSKSNPLSIKWMKGFVKRWPELRVVRPRSLEHARAKMASQETVDTYFNSLKQTIQRHGLTDKPHLIYNIDEKGVSVDHKPPHIVASASYCPSAVTSGKGKTVTILGGGNAAGVAIPPFFIFPGKKMLEGLLKGASPGTDGTMTDSGWSNGTVFREYLENHFLKYAPSHPDQKLLILLDGHKSHVSVGLSDWAKENNIVLFILPPHTSHILQPMDVSCYGPLQNIYNMQCHKFIRETRTVITRYNVCELACKSYVKAMCPENVMSGFKRTGIYPLNPLAVPGEFLLPATVYQELTDSGSEAGSQATVEGGVEVGMFERRETELRMNKTQSKPKQRDTMSKLVGGMEITDEVVGNMKEHEQKHSKPKVNKVNKKEKESKIKTEVKKLKVKKQVAVSKMPGPSHINLIPSSDPMETDSDLDTSDTDEDLCCVCNRRSPEELKGCISLFIVKWVQCDGTRDGYPCKHWVHLQFCTPVRVVRRGDTFLCPHCVSDK